MRLADTLRARLAEAGLADTAALEMRALPGIAAAGPVALDATAWADLAKNAADERNRRAVEMDALAPDPDGLPGIAARNWNSPDAVRAAFRAVGVTITTTGDDALAGIDHPLADHLRAYRSAGKMADTYGAKVAVQARSQRDCPAVVAADSGPRPGG